jgi:transaldolase/glucose-6-phosphate isomerase
MSLGDLRMDTVVQTADQTTVNPLKKLLAAGQSPWLDFIRRSFIEDGSLKKLVDLDGLGGVTSNPSIFEKAMGSGADYDDQFKQLAATGEHDANALYETMAVTDIQHATEVLRPVFDRTKGLDGFVSLEVSPYLALREQDTVTEARRLWAWVNRPNLMVKVPGTPECVPAIRTLIADGININVTLLFSQDAYKNVAEAYVAGLEQRHAQGQELSQISSVASFFVSRIDAQIDKRIDERIAAGDTETEALKAIRGKVAIANAKLAYAWYEEFSASARWQKLKAAGANPQRLLWASTGTKDKAYSDVLYIEELIGRDTVNTMPPATMDAFREHGRVRESLTENLEGARKILAETERLGLDLAGVTKHLVDDGVRLFSEAADSLLLAVAQKRAKLLGSKEASLLYGLPNALDKAVDARIEAWRRDGLLRKLWGRDAALWTGGDESKWLAWLDIVQERFSHADELIAFQSDIQNEGFAHVLLLGMGGSSLGPEVFGETFGHRAGWPQLHVLDSTDPQQIKTFENAVDLPKTLVIVSSKSGGTLEPNILKAYFWARMCEAVGPEKAGRHFVAITDPGSHMQKVAEADNFRKIFYGNPQIGGRYSVLSNFGLVPAAAIGIDLRAFLKSTLLMVQACSAGTPPLANPGVVLGAILGESQRAGHDKVTIIASPGIADLGAWLEQLLAESTGKQGKGLVPIDGEIPGSPDVYGQDRLFVYLHADDAPDAAQDEAVKALEKAGHPVVRVTISGHQEIGQQFFLWEFATAVAGSIIGIDAFDQPDVEASKIKTRELTDAFNKIGKLPDESPFAAFEGVQLFADAKNAEALKGGSLVEVLKAHFSRIKPGDYIGLLAYVERNAAHREALQSLRQLVRDRTHAAVAAEFGPRFLHSTGQAYKGGPNSGVFLQITAADAHDLAVPGESYTFGTAKAAQARGDFDVLAERGRRALRVHLGSDVAAGMAKLHEAIAAALA